jgi:hypothetical protein
MNYEIDLTAAELARLIDALELLLRKLKAQKAS